MFVVVVMDLETTGLNRTQCAILQIAASASLIRVKPGQPEEEERRVLERVALCRFNQYCKYAGEIPPIVQRITGITQTVLRENSAVSEAQSMLEFTRWLHTDVPARCAQVSGVEGARPRIVFVTHNGHSFDLPVLYAAFQRTGVEIAYGQGRAGLDKNLLGYVELMKKVFAPSESEDAERSGLERCEVLGSFDTLQISRLLDPRREGKRKLGVLYDEYTRDDPSFAGPQGRAHRADFDVFMTEVVFDRLLLSEAQAGLDGGNFVTAVAAQSSAATASSGSRCDFCFADPAGPHCWKLHGFLYRNASPLEARRRRDGGQQGSLAQAGFLSLAKSLGWVVRSFLDRRSRRYKDGGWQGKARGAARGVKRKGGDRFGQLRATSSASILKKKSRTSLPVQKDLVDAIESFRYKEGSTGQEEKAAATAASDKSVGKGAREEEGQGEQKARQELKQRLTYNKKEGVYLPIYNDLMAADKDSVLKQKDLCSFQKH